MLAGAVAQRLGKKVRMWVEHGERVDAQTAEFLTCPVCAERMERADVSGDLVCASCGHRKPL